MKIKHVKNESLKAILINEFIGEKSRRSNNNNPVIYYKSANVKHGNAYSQRRF